MPHALNDRHSDNWWLETLASAVTQDANGIGTVAVSSAGGGGGGAATIADGADATEGAIANAAVVGDNPGTVSAKLRGINKALADGSQVSKLSNGTNTADVVSNDSGYNGFPINNATKTIPFTTSAAGAQTLLANTDTRGYSSVSVVFTSVGVGLALQGQWAPVSAGSYINGQTWQQPNSPFSLMSGLGTTVSTIYESATHGDYFQLAISALTSGTVSGYVVLSSQPRPYNTMNLAFATGQSLQVTQSGTWNVGPSNATGAAIPANAMPIGGSLGGNLAVATVINSNTDTAGTVNEMSVMAKEFVWNGASFERKRGNITGPVVGAGASSTQTNVAVTTYSATKLAVIVNITAGAGSVVVAINGTTNSGYTYPILTSASLTGVGVSTLRVFPGATPSANAVANDILPRSLSITVTVTGTITYGVDYVLGV